MSNNKEKTGSLGVQKTISKKEKKESKSEDDFFVLTCIHDDMGSSFRFSLSVKENQKLFDLLHHRDFDCSGVVDNSDELNELVEQIETKDFDYKNPPSFNGKLVAIFILGMDY